MAVLHRSKAHGRGLGLHPIGCTTWLWRTAPLQQQLPLVALYKCYAFTFMPFFPLPTSSSGPQTSRLEVVFINCNPLHTVVDCRQLWSLLCPCLDQTTAPRHVCIFPAASLIIRQSRKNQFDTSLANPLPSKFPFLSYSSLPFFLLALVVGALNPAARGLWEHRTLS